MASGARHNAASLAAALPVGGIATLVLGPVIGIAAVTGCVLGIFINPDLDQITIQKAEWKIVKYIPVVGWSWMAFWDLYARLIPHRGISHWPVLGTLTRLLYIEIWDTVINLIVNHGRLGRWAFSAAEWRVVIGVAVGLMASDALHWVMDRKVVRWIRSFPSQHS